MTDFSKTLIHASSMGVLFTEPKDVAAKKAGELSGTAKTHLIKIYIQEHWGRRKDVSTKQMEKGNLVEPDVISLIGNVDQRVYVKNEHGETNEWAIGMADIVEFDEIIDVKASWEAETFLPKLLEKIDKMYEIQLQTYMWLYNKPKARLSYGLVSAPYILVQNELKKLLWNMDVVSEESPEYKLAAQEVYKNMVFDDIPEEERVIHLPVERNEEIIQQMPGKVAKAREFLQFFSEKHKNFNIKYGELFIC
jgi:hypothetical protein